jgi:hypothetical protein
MISFIFKNTCRTNDHSSETCRPSEILKPNEAKLIKESDLEQINISKKWQRRNMLIEALSI